MTDHERRLDSIRSWLFALCMLATNGNLDAAIPMFERTCKQHGVEE